MADVVILEDREAWMAEAGSFTTIDFTGFPKFFLVSDEYADLGVLFESGRINLSDTLFDDGSGLSWTYTPIIATFDTPQAWVATDYVGEIVIHLFMNDDLVFESSEFSSTGGPQGFAGLLLDNQVFDRIEIFDPTDATVVIDNLHFGSAEGGPDVNGDGTVDVQDLIAVLLAWGTADPAADVNNDGTVDVADLVEVISDWS